MSEADGADWADRERVRSEADRADWADRGG